MPDCRSACSGCLSRENFSLKHDNVDQFHRSMWNKPGDISLGYVIYRVAVALVMVAGIAAHIGSTLDTLGSKWLIYMTNQGITLLTIHYVIYAGIISARYFSTGSQGWRGFPLIYSVSWGMQSAFTVVAIYISIIYWGILNKYVVDNNLIQGAWLNFLNFFLHGVNSISCIIDMFITARPVKFGHVYLPVIFGLYYTVFSLIYWAAGGTGICRCEDGIEVEGCVIHCDSYIYPILDWEDNAGMAVLMIFISILALALVQGFVFGLYKLRCLIHRRTNV